MTSRKEELDFNVTITAGTVASKTANETDLSSTQLVQLGNFQRNASFNETPKNDRELSVKYTQSARDSSTTPWTTTSATISDIFREPYNWYHLQNANQAMLQSRRSNRIATFID